MKNVPAQHHTAIQVAVRIARILAEAEIVHPVSDYVGEMDVMEWADNFVAERGEVLATVALDRSEHSEVIAGFAHMKAHNNGWVLREIRETQSESPADHCFKRQLAMALAIQQTPPHVSRSCARQALVEVVVKELQQRALHSLRGGGLHEKGVMSFETDGRIEKLKMHGVLIASCPAGVRDRSEWIAALESNLGIRIEPRAEHQIHLEVDGRDILCSSKNVRVQVFSDRMVDDEDGKRSVLFNFTPEGVITDCLRADGSLVATDASMYDDVVEALVGAKREQVDQES